MSFWGFFLCASAATRGQARLDDLFACNFVATLLDKKL